MLSDERADVCIIGGGIGGLTTAYLLLKEGKSVVLLEDGQIASGESGRTTAHLMSAIDDRFYLLEKNLGKETAKIAAESHSAAVDMIEEIVRTEKIDCEFTRLDGYLFAGSKQEGAKFLEQECQAAKEAGLTGAQLVDKAPIPSFNTGVAVKFPQQGQFHPTKYLYNLAAAVSNKGGKIFTETHASAFEENRVKTQDGNSVFYKHLVVATNEPVNDKITMYTKVAPHRSYVIAGKIKRGVVPVALYWDTADPYHYVRLAKGPDEEHELLVVGGEDHPTGQASDFDERYKRLESWTRERFPEMQEIVDKWSGQVVETVDTLGYLGRNPGDRNVYIITGDSGTGMTHTTIGAMLIKDLILGKSNRWEKTYDPSRKPHHLADVTTWVKHHFEVTAQYTKLLKAGDLADVEDLAKGEGCVKRHLKDFPNVQHAYYRHTDGSLHVISAICPHLGGVVQWNTSEKTWDCPCHGSRFDCFGKVVNGPANTNLTPLNEEQKKGQQHLQSSL